MENEIIRDCIGLSTGTISTCIFQATGKTVKLYTELERIHLAFALWADDEPRDFKSWSEAWAAWFPTNLPALLA